MKDVSEGEFRATREQHHDIFAKCKALWFLLQQ